MVKEINTQVSVVPASKRTSIAQWGQVLDRLNYNVKEAVRVASTGPITGTYLDGVFTPDTPITDIDGVTLAENDRVFIKDQIDATQNGIYIVDATGDTLTRSEDFLSGSKVMNNTRVVVSEGTDNADTKWMLVSDGVLTVDTSSLVFVKDVGTEGTKRAKGTITGNDTDKEFTIAHNFNLTNPRAYHLVIKNSTGGEVWGEDVPTTGAESNSVTVKFDVAPVTGETLDVFIECLE